MKPSAAQRIAKKRKWHWYWPGNSVKDTTIDAGPRHGVPWNDREHSDLLREHRAGWSLKQIAGWHGRTERSVRMQLELGRVARR